MRGYRVIGLTILMALPAEAQQSPERLALPHTAVVQDSLQPLTPHSAKLGGLLGDRFSKSEALRLLRVNETELVAGFQRKPGSHPWIGEHVGKWLHAASLTYANTGNKDLRAKMDRVAAALMAAQEADGYLGTYVREKRFGLYPDADWDVWVHKYDLIGLLSYYQFTRNKQALATCRRVGDVLIATFGPGKKSIISAGTHVGMASTSVLEPMVLLYRATANKKYIDFARYIVSAWEEPNGPKIISTLLRERSVRKTANAKAYEMLSNFAGLLELHRATGDRKFLEPVLIAWEDIAKRRLYITGTGSSHELWQDEFHLPNGSSSSIGETCVTVSWIQLNMQLLRLLGEAKFADQIERSVYNHLLGAQKPTGDQWCYYTPLTGTKPYGPGTNCCVSSGPRGVALLPTMAVMAGANGPVVNLYGRMSATVKVGGGSVQISQDTEYPLGRRVVLSVNPKDPQNAFELRLRNPAWCDGASLAINGRPASPEVKNGYLSVRRIWKKGDQVTISFPMPAKMVLGDHENAGRAAMMVGPLVLAADSDHNPGIGTLNRVALKAVTPADLELMPVEGASAASEPVWETEGLIRTPTELKETPLRLTPFYAAGQSGRRYLVWVPLASAAPVVGSSLFSQAEEKRSRFGNASGSIVDDDPGTYVVTFDNTKRDLDWYEVSLAAPIEIDRVAFSHGHGFHDGGWFDASRGRPKVLVRKEPNGRWEEVAELASYPATTASNSAGLTDGQLFEASFPVLRVYGVRVQGVPASGDNARQSFSSCGELQAFRKH